MSLVVFKDSADVELYLQMHVIVKVAIVIVIFFLKFVVLNY